MRKRVRVPLLVRRVAQRTGVSAVELFDGGAEPWADEVHAHADWRCEPRCSVYAQGGADLVHPNPHGHRLLARRAAATVASGLLAAWCAKHEQKGEADQAVRHHRNERVLTLHTQSSPLLLKRQLHRRARRDELVLQLHHRLDGLATSLGALQLGDLAALQRADERGGE